MNEFYFDLQRFDDTYSITAGGEAQTLSSGTHTITVTNTDSTTTSYSITVSDSGSASISADTDGTLKLSVTSGTVSNLTYSETTTSNDSSNTEQIPEVNLLAGSGTFQAYKKQQITLGTQKVLFSFSSEGSNSELTPGPNTLKVTSSDNDSIKVIVNSPIKTSETWISFSFGEFYYADRETNENVKDLELNINSSSNYSFSVPPFSSENEENTRRITYHKNEIEKCLTPTNGTITLGKDETGTYVSDLEKGDTFSTYDRKSAVNSNIVTYKMGITISATRKNSETEEEDLKFYGDEDLSKIYLDKLDFDTSKDLHPALAIAYDETTGYGTLPISSDVVSKFTSTDSSLTVVSKDNGYTYSYGTLEKVSDTSFKVVQGTGYTKYAAINIDSGYTVKFSSTITNATITVADTTVFSVTNTAENYSLTSGTSPLSVGGATGLSLTSGTLLTSTATQTIAAGNYSVYGYNDSNSSNDGITIGLSDGSVIVGDIDTNESFTVSTTSATSNYTLLGAGLLEKTGDTYSIYRNSSTGGTFDSSLTLGSDGELLIAPDSNKILEIGTTNTQSGVVFDSKSSPVSLYAGLTKDDSGNYTLNAISGAVSELTGWASTISLTGSNTYTIHENLAGENVTIATKDSQTTFKVTATDNNKTFTVSSGTAEAPTITSATAITLLSGSITATKDQTITLGDSNNTFAVTSSTNGIKISFDTNTNTATINAYKGDSFTVGGENYTVDDGDGITFVVDKKTGKVTKISDLETVGDTFTRDSTGYSVKGAGFVTGDSPWSIWSADNSHSLSGGSVETASLTVASNWLGVMTIDGSVTVPAGTNAGLLTDSNFDYTYGELKYGSNSATLTHGDNDSGTLKSIKIDSGSTQYSLTAEGSNFYNVSIAAPNSSIMVGNSTNGSYQVTLDGAGGNTGLVGATSASLISGKLTATSILTGGVVVDKATVIPGESVTLTTGAYGASISGLSYGEKFTVNNNEYVFTGAGLRNGTQLKRGTKTNSSVTSNTLALASVTSNEDWLGMLAVSTSGGVEIGDNRNIYDVFLVDDYTNDTQPSKLYGELKTVSGGYSLSTVTNFDKWEDNYTITVDTTTVTISSGFEGASIKASQVGAGFKVDSLSDNATEFVVTDTTANTGVTLSGAKAITQTDGLIAVASSGIQSVTIGEHTIANSANLSLDVSASGGLATLSSLDENENFNIDSTGYSIISGLGLRTDNQFFKDSSVSSFKSATLSELADPTNTNEWIYIAAIKENILTVPPTIDSSANEWLVLDDTKKTRYAQLTKDATSGVYSITKDTNDWDDKFTISVGTNETLNLTADFKDKKISGKSSGALFTVSDDASYSVIDATGGASIGNATNISLSAGTISLNSANQTISGGDSVISGNGTDIKLTVTDNKATVSALATGDSFKVAGVTYTLLSNGRLQRGSDNSIWNGSTIKTDDSGSIAVASLGSNNWNGAISTDSNGNVTIDSAATAVLDTISSATAFIVKGDAPASIYGSFTKDSDTYKLSTSGINTGATLPSVTITEDVGKLNFTKDFVNVPITAGSTTFTATKASSGYTVNYDSSELSVDDATAIDLTTGTLAIKNSTQLVTANNQSVQAVSEAVNVTYDSSNGVTVDGITTADESVKINNNTYTLASDTTGDGISVNINNGTTTIKDITVGDKFVIDDETFLYTSAGLTKTEANSDKISYMLKAVHPTSGELTLDELQSIDEDTWLGIYLADSGNVTLSSNITHSVVLVDSVTNPTTNYGQVKLSNGTYTLQKYSGDDEALKAIADQIQNPTSIIVEKGITAVIDPVFSSSTTSIPVKANNATSITVTDSSNKSYIIGGTVDKFIPSTMTFTPAENDEFTIDGTTYLMTVAGLTKGNKIWTKANVTDYVLPDDDAWSAIVKLTTDNILDITKISPEEGSNIVVDNSSSTRWATLDYTAATDTTPATYSLKYIDSDKLAAVQLADGTATFTVNYVTTITTGNGTYTINDNDYTGSGLVVATTASTSTLQDGTVTLDNTTQAVTATNGGSISVTSGEITATASNGTWDTLNNLTEGDIFKIGDNTYKVYGSNTLAKLNSSGEPEKIYNSYITNGKLDYSKIVGDDYSAVIQLNSDDQLDLTKKLSVTSAIVVGQNDGTIDPTVRVAQIDYSETDDAYTLSETTDGVISTLKGVLLGTAVKSFNTTLETTVITSGIDTFTVNGKDFAALNALTITTASNNSAFLTNGKVTVAEGATVTTRYTDTSNHDTTITSTTGTLTVIADSTANTVTISDMDAGDVFNVGTNSYTMTSVGLTNGTKLNYNALKNSGITTAEFDLTDDAWKNIVPTDSGVLTITNAVGSNVFVADVDTSNPSSAVKYGTITKSSDDGIYTLTQADGNDTALEGIILTGVKVTFPTTCTNTNITAKGATFKVTASKPFTIDSASTTLSMSDEVTAVELTSGTLQATNGIPITPSGNVITTTSGTMTVGIDDTGVFVGGLNEDETFIVGSTSYKKTAAGLLDVTNQKLRSAVTDTYYIGSSFDRIIEAPNGALDLSTETQSAEVYDSISAPTTHMASLTVDDNGLTLKSVDGGISTVTLAKDAKLTVTFAATVNGSGTTTVNNVPYEGTNLVIDATATSSSLQSGTVTIDSGGSVKATKDSTALAVTSGSITATAADGRFTNIASLVSGDIFTFNSKTYTQTAIGLISSDNKLNGDISTDVTVANLSGTAWQDIHQATSGALTINSSTSSNAIVVDIADDKAQSKRYGTLTKSGDTYTLTQADNDSRIASITLDSVKASLPTTCANTTITANDATFTVTASEIFTVDATSNIPKLSNVTAINLTDGTIQALNNVPVTVGENVITTTSGTMTVGVDDTGVFVGNLNENETFTVDGTSYKKTAAGLIDVTNQKFSADVTDTYYISTSFNRIIAADGSTLDLSNETQSAEVYDSISNPTTHMASLKVSGKKLTLNEVDGGISTITLAKDANLTVTFTATVNGSGTTTVNTVSYDGTNLVIDATATSSTLQSGTVTIDSGESVQATKDSTALAVTEGSITATAANGRFTNIASLVSGDIFTFNSKTYTQTAIGLVSSDNKLNEDVSTEVTIADLSGTAWQDIYQATSGALTINTSTGSDVLVVDITNDKAQSKRYGTLTKSGGIYTLAQESTDSKLASITLDGVKASLPTTCANTTITANDATFTVTASDPFTVDATSDIPTLSNVTAITLTDGTIQALNNIPVTVGENVITTTSGTMTVGVDDTGVFVGGLNEDETFTVDGTSYKMTAAGLMDVTNQKLRAAVTDTYYLGSSFDRIISADGSTLDLSNETQSAEVYDSISDPTTHMATLKVSGGKLTLSEVDGGIDTITLAKDANLTVKFAATVNGSGNTTVNKVSYNGTDLVIDATATSSTLQSGTVTIDSGESVQATKDSTPLEVTSGSIDATATNGKFTTLNNVDASDQFSFNDNSYIQSSLGLIKDSTISAELATSTINISNLDSAKWLDFIAPSGGVLNLTNATVNALVLDSATAPTTKLADLTISNSRFNLKGADNPTDIEAVTLPENSNINVDFATQVYAPTGSVTVNSTTFNAASEVIIDFDGSTATLYEGTVNLGTTKPTVKATNDSSALKVLRGSLTATVFDGLLVSLGELDTKDSFSFNDVTYTKTALGLMKDDLISENLAGSTIEIADIDTATWSNITVPLNQTIDLTSATNAIVCDDATNPTVKFATFTNSDGVLTLTDDGDAADYIKSVDIAADTTLTVDFVTQVNAPSGSVIVNSKFYNGTSELVIQSDGSTSTLTSGTVTLNAGDSVSTTNGNTISVSDGDGLTVTVGNNVTIDGMNIGDAFKVDDNSYKVTESGLINTSGKLWTGSDFTDGLTVDALNLATNWTGIVVAKDGVLSVDSSTLANDETSTVVDDLSNPTITYGKLTKADDAYTLTKDADNTLSGIKVDSVKIDIDNNLAGVPLTVTTPDGIKTSLNVTASAKFSNFTVDATGNNPTVNDVNAIEISAGKIELFDGQTITLAEDAQEVAIFAGNGTFNVGDETFTIAELGDNTLVEFDFDTDGNANSVIGFNKDSTVTIDGTTYTAPENNAILHYTEEDNWYFDGFAYDDYTVTVDSNGNVLVMPGVKFSNVISSGKTLSDDGTIKFAADYTKTPVTIVNQGKVALNINDADDNTLAENLSKHKNVTFNADGVETEDLTAVAGATFKLQDTKSLTAGDTKVTANDNDCEIGVGEDGTSISADKDATINAPADIALTLNAGDYNVNGADFTGSGTTTATTTADGVKLDLANSDSIIYDSMTLSSAGTATIDNSDGVTLSGGAKVTNATNRALTVDGTAYLDDKTINTAKATEVATTSAGIKVGNRNVSVTGDNDGYTVNIAKRDVVGLENIGNSDGVTVDGLKNATIKTDKAGSLTAGGKTFIYNNDSVTYGLDNGSIVSISDAEQIIGDFSDRVSVNGDGIRLTGSTDVTLSANKNGVTKLELSDEGTYRVNNKTYEIEDEGGFAFSMSGGAVTGVESVENGSLIILQNESGFGVNDGIVTLTSNSNPVTLGIVDSNIVSVSGVDGTINGLENATVYGLSNAVINNKPLRISGSDEYDAIVADGVVNSIGGITDGAIISSAPNVTVTTAENGTFTFDSTEYKVNDTLDASVDFTTDENSHVIEINNFAGAVSGVLEGVQSLNGKDFSISGAGEVSVTSDGDNITGIIGITDGTEINGDVADLHYVLPEGKVTVNGIAYELEGDDNGALFVSNDGRALTGLDKDATLSVGASGNYTINGTRFSVEAGDAFTVNRDGAYVIDPKNPPISEKTESADILARGENPVYVRPTATGNQTVDLTGDSNLALIDSANANVSVQAGAGNDSVVVRHDAAVDVNLDENGSTLIIPTAGKVTLENYNGDNAKVQTFDYSDVSGAIKSNEIKFGDGVMTMGDAIVTYDTAATDTGSTTGKLINAHGKELAVGFTYQNGGLLDESTSNENYLMKGNYAENTSDTQKGGGSTILTGSGNDTILAGAGDYIDAGGGYNQIYLTDKNMRNSVPEGATIVMNEGAYDTVSNFAGGFSGDDDKILIKNLSELGFGYGAGDLVMSAGSGQITFDNLSGNDHYELKLTDGTNEYKAAVAKAESVMAVNDSNEAEIFYGNENGISFSEYTGAVEVNLNENAGSLNGSAVQYYGLNKVIVGAGDTSLIGAANTPNTLTAGTGNGSIWSNSGRDLMVGNTDAGKSGTTTFFYMPGDGRDTITNFDFMSGTTDINADKIQLDDASGVTDVFLNGNDVMIGINNGADDYLRLVDAKGKTFRFNDDLIAKVDNNLEFDGFTNCYVGIGNTPTLTIGEGMGDVGIWLSDDSLEYHGIWYDGNFAVLDASAATGRNILAGNEMNNLIIGGASENSIWGGYASSNDTLVGGSGQNTFFFALENGHDVIQNAHDGDLISLEDIYLDNIARADITGGGAIIELTDGSRLEVQSSAAVDYRLQDGTTYTADRTKGEWVQK